MKKVNCEAAAQRRPAQSERKTASFPRNDRPYGLKRAAFQTDIAQEPPARLCLAVFSVVAPHGAYGMRFGREGFPRGGASGFAEPGTLRRNGGRTGGKRPPHGAVETPGTALAGRLRKRHALAGARGPVAGIGRPLRAAFSTVCRAHAAPPERAAEGARTKEDTPPGVSAEASPASGRALQGRAGRESVRRRGTLARPLARDLSARNCGRAFGRSGDFSRTESPPPGFLPYFFP